MANLEATPDALVLRSKVWRSLLIFFIVAIVMGFAAFTSAYIVSKSNNFWVNIELPQAFAWSCGVLVVCSVVVQLSLWACNRGEKQLMLIGLVLTFATSLVFAYTQWMGWAELVNSGNFFSGPLSELKGEYGTDYSISYNNNELILEDGKYFLPQDELRKKPLNSRLMSSGNTASSYIYILSAAHLAHVALGLILLLIVLVKALMGRYGVNYNNGVKLIANYWHFLGALWIYLFLFITFFR